MTVVATAQGRLYLVDAHAYLHRAYHALPPLKTSSGEPVGALYGFARMLLGLVKREKPDFMAVCFDAPGPTFRHQAYAQYKAHRKEIDADLKAQLAVARSLVEAMGLACVTLPGYEADDLMATLTARAAGLRVVLVTLDKDALQLVADRVQVLHEGKHEYLGAGEVLGKFGVEPSQMVDYLTLVGDSSDNVPGVPGIGPAGAAKLLKRFKTLDRILEAARSGSPDLTPKLSSALRAACEQALLNRKLIRLDAGAPVPIHPHDCRLRTPDPERLLPLLKRFEFNSLIRELVPRSLPDAAGEPGIRRADVARLVAAGPRAAPGATARPVPGQPPLVSPRFLEVSRWLEAFGAATEVSMRFCALPANELFERKGWALALAIEDGRVTWAEPADVRKHASAFERILGAGVGKIGHDLRASLTPLRRLGFCAGGTRFDTWLAAYCLNPSAEYDFETVSAQWLGRAFGSPGADARSQALEQACAAWPLARKLREELEKRDLISLYEEIELPLIEVIAGMETAGIGLDRRYLQELSAEFQDRMKALRREIDAAAGTEVNPNSPRQLGRVLFENLKLPVVHKTPKGGASTDEETLRILSDKHPLPRMLLEYREFSKLQSTYVDGLLERIDPETGRVHTRFNQAGTATGRLSSLDPNLQNIPVRTALGQKIRGAFVPSPGHFFLSGDYSQIDLRVLAHLSEDPALAEAFRRDEDVHLRTACEIFGVPAEAVDAEMRRRAKAVNFGIVYGQTAHGLGVELGIPMKQAKEYIEKYFARYAGVARWSQAALEAARRDGCVRTILGRVRHLPDLLAKNTQVRLFNERVAINTPIQGSSADIIKRAMIRIDAGMRPVAPERGEPEVGRKPLPARWKSRLLLQVHDELLFETPQAELKEFGAWVRREMEAAVLLRVPLRVDLKWGENWRKMRPWEKAS
ncbi:MAG: DNA polymerase I [Elusimicrobia bacterium]|nr:DNA polymerase I [Elusimicrobiota bacterium]